MGDTVDAVEFGVIPVVRQFVLNIKGDEQAAGHANSKTCYVDDAVYFSAGEIAPGDFQEMF
jgi:hypothetical protein